MHREDTATLTTYLSDYLKIFTCLNPLDDQPIVIFNRVQDPSPPIQNNFLSYQQNRANYLNNKPNTAQQPRYNALYSAAAKRYFATITLSPDELDLLIYDDSCEEIFNDKEFVKIATSGRHRKLDVIYVKHNSFHQSKWSRTIDLNTTHIILFNSLRDIQQIEYLGKQLNCLQLIKEAYKLATAEPFGHLMIDRDPKTSQGLRFSSQLIGPDPSIFYTSSPEAVITIKNEKETFAYAQAMGK